MIARVATTHTEPEKIEGLMRNVREQTIPVLRHQKGFRAYFGLVDRKTGKAIGISIWETAEDERASSEAVTQSREQALQQAGVTGATVVELFEVAAKW